MHFRAMKPCLAYDSLLKHLYYFKNQMSSLRKGASRGFDVQIWIPQRDRYFFSSLPPFFATTNLHCSGCGRQKVRDGEWNHRERVDIFFRFPHVSSLCRHRDNLAGASIHWYGGSLGTSRRILNSTDQVICTSSSDYFFSARGSSSVMSFTLNANSFSAVYFI
jgi:hypothetical protein